MMFIGQEWPFPLFLPVVGVEPRSFAMVMALSSAGY